jgi:vacuolar protein sorting-associated protein 35
LNLGSRGGGGNAPGLVDGVNSPEMIVKVSSLHVSLIQEDNADVKHFKNTLIYILTRQRQAAEKADGEDKKRADWEDVDVIGGCLKMGIPT